MTRSNWFLWAALFLFLATITRYVYLGSLPEDHCQQFWGEDRSCSAMKTLGITQEDVDARFGRRAER